MSKPRKIELSESQRAELVRVRDHHAVPHYREKASAILKIADGMPLVHVAQRGLLKAHHPETVREWVKRYEQEGIAGFAVRKGRGRKTAFFSRHCPASSG